jgi:all-trans-retinol 13,14-reductase
MNYDVIIIGSGLGGLVCGAILASEGNHVCVLEKNQHAGGNLQTFERDGHRFETGLHYIGSMDPGQPLHQFFKYLGIADRLKLRRLETNGYDRLTFSEEKEVYYHNQGWEEFEEGLIGHFPGDMLAIKEYASRVRQTIRSIPLYDLEHAENLRLSPENLEGCAMGTISSLTDNIRLRSVLAGANAVYHGAARRTPWYLHSCVRNSLVSSSWRPENGSDQISEELVRVIRQNSGTVSTDAEVTRFRTAKGRVQAVELKDGSIIEGWQFISNIHPSVTLQMVDPSMFRSGYRKQIANLENTPGFFSIYMILNEGSLPYQNFNHFHYSSDDYFRDELPESAWPQTYLLYTPAHGEKNGYATIASVLSFMPFSQVSRWARLKPEERGQSYQDFKEERAEKLLKEAEKRYPGLRQNILKYYVSTPLTFQDYTGTKEGSAYGVLKDCHHPMESIISTRTRVPNLYLTGQNLNIHGVLGTTISAVLTCTEIIGFKELITKIVRA